MKFVKITLHWRCTSVRFSIQSTGTPVHDGRPRVRGRLVSRSVSAIKFPTLFRYADSFTWATRILSSGQRYMRHLCEHTSLTHLTTSTMYTCGLSIGINVLPGFWHIIWACGLSMCAANGRDFTVVFLSWWCGLCDLMHVSSFVYFKKICACVCVCLRQWAGNEDNGWASWYIHRGECVAGTWWCPQVSLRLTVLLSCPLLEGVSHPSVVFLQRVVIFNGWQHLLFLEK